MQQGRFHNHAIGAFVRLLNQGNAVVVQGINDCLNAGGKVGVSAFKVGV
jgi:hypothetical protein